MSEKVTAERIRDELTYFHGAENKFEQNEIASVLVKKYMGWLVGRAERLEKLRVEASRAERYEKALEILRELAMSTTIGYDENGEPVEDHFVRGVYETANGALRGESE